MVTASGSWLQQQQSQRRLQTWKIATTNHWRWHDNSKQFAGDSYNNRKANNAYKHKNSDSQMLAMETVTASMKVMARQEAATTTAKTTFTNNNKMTTINHRRRKRSSKQQKHSIAGDSYNNRKLTMLTNI